MSNIAKLHASNLIAIEKRKKTIQKEREKISDKLEKLNKALSELERTEGALVAKYKRALKKEEEAKKEAESYSSYANKIRDRKYDLNSVENNDLNEHELDYENGGNTATYSELVSNG